MAAEALIVEDAYQRGYADAIADMRKKKEQRRQREQAQKIFPEDAPVGDYDEFNERDMKIAFMATGIERRSRAAMIEESEAGNEKTKTTGS